METILEQLHKKEFYIPTIVIVVALLGGLGFSTYYLVGNLSNTAPSAQVVDVTAKVKTKTVNTNTTDLESDVKGVDTQTTNLDAELTNVDKGLNDAQTNLVY